jgi:hypothetical protein
MPYDRLTLKTYRNEILVSSHLAWPNQFSVFDILRYFCQMNTNRFQIFITVYVLRVHVALSYIKSCSHEVAKHKSGVMIQKSHEKYKNRRNLTILIISNISAINQRIWTKLVQNFLESCTLPP